MWKETAVANLTITAFIYLFNGSISIIDYATLYGAINNEGGIREDKDENVA
jgi:hypothetical protein